MANYVSNVTIPTDGGSTASYNIRELFPHVGNCTVAASAAAKTVTIGNFKLYTGAWVVVKFSNTNSADVASLTLNVDGTGAKPIKYRNANLSSAGLLIANRYTYFVYDGTNYQIVGDFDTNSDTYDRNRYKANIKAGTSALVAGNIIVGKDGVFNHLKSGGSFDISYPILYLNEAVAAGGTTKNSYDIINFTITTTQSISLTSYLPVFIKGTLSGKIFTPVSTAPLTQTVPTTDDGYQYMYLGNATSTSAVYLTERHPIYAYKNGAFGEIVHTASNVNGYTVGKSVPSDAVFTDTKVTQSETTTTNYRPIVFGATNSTDTSTLAATVTDQTYVSTLLYAQPKDGILYASRMYLKAPGSKGQLNLLTSKYNVMLRNDDSNTYFLVTAQNDPTGTWTSARPLTINNSTGVCNINGNAATATTAANANVTVTNGSTTSTDYGIVFAVHPNTTEGNTLRKTNDFRYQMKDGAANTEGFATIVLGNNKKLSEANNKSGNIYLYSSGGNWHLINTTSTTSSITHTLPATTGTILNSGTTSFTQSLTSGTKIGTIKINGTSTDLYCQTNTDTKNTAGSTDTSSKIYLIGATSQAANPQTYSDNEVYTTSGVLTTKKVQVGGGSCTMEYNSTTQTLDFVFA